MSTEGGGPEPEDETSPLTELPTWVPVAARLLVIGGPVVAAVAGAVPGSRDWLIEHNNPLVTRGVLWVIVVLGLTASVVDLHRLLQQIGPAARHRRLTVSGQAVLAAKQNLGVWALAFVLAAVAPRLILLHLAAWLAVAIAVGTQGRVALCRDRCGEHSTTFGQLFDPLFGGVDRWVRDAVAVANLDRLLRKRGMVSLASLLAVVFALLAGVTSAHAETRHGRAPTVRPLVFSETCTADEGRDRFYRGAGPDDRSGMADAWWHVGVEEGGCAAHSPERHGDVWVVNMHTQAGAAVVGFDDGAGVYLNPDAREAWLPLLETGVLVGVDARIRNHWGDAYVGHYGDGQCMALVRHYFDERYEELDPASFAAVLHTVGSREAGIRITDIAPAGHRTTYEVEITWWVDPRGRRTEHVDIVANHEDASASIGSARFPGGVDCDADAVARFAVASARSIRDEG